MSDTLAVEEDKKPIFVSPFNKLDKTAADAMLAASNPTQFSHYLNGAFVDLMQQTRVRNLSSKSSPADWASGKDDFEWSSDQIITLLDFYSHYPELWDTKHERYMNKEKRKQLISQLSEKIGAPEHAVNVKFQRLRVHFSRELRKEESSVGEAHPYQSKWKYYGNMLFLKDTLKCRQRVRQHNQEKDSISLMMDLSSVANNSDSGHSSPEAADATAASGSGSAAAISPGKGFENKENMSPPVTAIGSKGSKPAPLSPSLITTPFSSLATSLVPPLLSNNPLFSNLPTPLPTPPASLLNSFASLEQLLSPKMLGPLLMGGKGKEQASSAPGGGSAVAAGSLIAPTPQVPNSPLTPNVVCSGSAGAAPGFWKSPHVLTGSSLPATKEDEDVAAMKSYQAKRQKILKETAAEERIRSVEECDYFSLHVSESLRKMDILCAEECKRAIQNTIYQYIVKSCQRTSQAHQAAAAAAASAAHHHTGSHHPGYLPASYLSIFNSNLAAASPNTTNVRVINKGNK